MDISMSISDNPIFFCAFLLAMKNNSLSENIYDCHNIESTKVYALGALLTGEGYHAHQAFMVVYQRTHKFFGTDQTWRSGLISSDTQADFDSIPSFATEVTTNENLVPNADFQGSGHWQYSGPRVDQCKQ